MPNAKDKPLQRYKRRTPQSALDPMTVPMSHVLVLNTQVGENSTEHIPLNNILSDIDQPIVL